MNDHEVIKEMVEMDIALSLSNGMQVALQRQKDLRALFRGEMSHMNDEESDAIRAVGNFPAIHPLSVLFRERIDK